jgi:hypothetical protein
VVVHDTDDNKQELLDVSEVTLEVFDEVVLEVVEAIGLEEEVVLKVLEGMVLENDVEVGIHSGFV